MASAQDDEFARALRWVSAGHATVSNGNKALSLEQRQQIEAAGGVWGLELWYTVCQSVRECLNPCQCFSQNESVDVL